MRSLLPSLLVAGLLGCGAPPPAGPTPGGAARPAPPTVGAERPAPSPAAAATPAAVDGNEHLVVAVQGQLSIKRATWTQFHPASFGATVRAGDLLRVEDAASVKIACADLTLVTLRAGTAGAPCPASRPTFQRDGSAVRATRADTAPGFPLVIAPRKTNLLADRPMIRWTAVSGATGYRVSIRGPDVNWSVEAGTKTELAYPPDAPRLKPGEGYKVTVVATTPGGARSSDEESLPDLGFVPLRPEERQAVQELGARIEQLELEEPQRRFLLARLYTAKDRRLYAEAIEQLEPLADPLKETAIGRELAETYRAISLNRLAEQRHLLAIELAEQARDLESQALGHDALARLYEGLGNQVGARERLQKALDLYWQVGDPPKVEELQARLARLPKP
jgi:hypothetical protein